MPAFARVVRAMQAPSAITLHVGGVSIGVRDGFDPALLRAVVAALVEGSL